jgi:exopolysaccharide production protein ExoZ
VGYFMMGAGGTGVDLFFVLSGFLIYGMVLRPQLDKRKFYIRRLQRIYPAFLAVFLFYLAASPFLHLAQQAGDKELTSRIPTTLGGGILYVLENLAFLPGVFSIQPIMSVAWSLSYEWFFYLFIPALVLLLGLYRWRRISRVLLFSIAGVTFVAAVVLWPGVFYLPRNIELTHIRAIMFLGGILVFEFLKGSGKTPIFKRRWELLAIIGFAVALGYRAFINVGADYNLAFVPKEALAEGGMFFGYSVLTLVALAPGTVLRGIFGWAPLRWLGNMSYSFYLLHGVPLHAFMKLIAAVHLTRISAAGQWLFFLGAMPFIFAGTAACCAALFLLVEKPMSLAKQRPAVFPSKRALQHNEFQHNAEGPVGRPLGLDADA